MKSRHKRVTSKFLLEETKLDSYSLCARSLYTHIKGAHEGLKYYCNDCDYKATHRGTLTTHIKAVHEGLKYLCNDCEYKATTRSSF